MFPAKLPAIIPPLFPGFVWRMPPTGKDIYLTFDDGPLPQITKFALKHLAIYNAKATFFCIGENAMKHPDVYAHILSDGHAVGNHSYNHYNGWDTSNKTYINDVAMAAKYINSNLYRPPYGKISPGQAKVLKKDYKIIMWDVLSQDYVTNVKPDKVVANIVNNVKPGSIVVMHDSLKAMYNLMAALPVVLEKLTDKGYVFKSIEI